MKANRKPLKLLIADDHALFRETLAAFFSKEEPGCEIAHAKDMPSAMKILEADSSYDLVLLDMRMPGMNGLDGFRKIKEAHPALRAGLISGLAEPEDVQAAMKLGAVAYFPKTLPAKSLIKAMHLVLSGEKFVPIDPESHEVMPSYYSDAGAKGGGGKRPADFGLTPRETDVLRHLAKGSSNKEIGTALGVQVVTVKLHVKGICRKLNVANRTQAALIAKEIGV